MFTYEIIEKNDDDTQATIIKKSGITTEFTLKNVYDHKLNVEQSITAKKAEVEVSKAKQANFTTNYPFIQEVLDMIAKEEKAEGLRGVLFMWIKEDMEIAVATKMIEEREALIKEYEEELDTIHAELDLPTPIKIAYVKGNE